MHVSCLRLRFLNSFRVSLLDEGGSLNYRFFFFPFRAGLIRNADVLLGEDTKLDFEQFKGVDCILVDECQFLRESIIDQFRKVMNRLFFSTTFGHVPFLAWQAPNWTPLPFFLDRRSAQRTRNLLRSSNRLPYQFVRRFQAVIRDRGNPNIFCSLPS